MIRPVTSLLERGKRWITVKRERWGHQPREIQLAEAPVPFQQVDSGNKTTQMAKQPVLNREVK